MAFVNRVCRCYAARRGVHRALPQKQHGEDIRFQRAGTAGIVTLASAEGSNPLTPLLVRALGTVLRNWASDGSVSFVIIRSGRPAFSSGVPFGAVTADIRAGKPPLDFFAEEYRLNALIAKYPKPVVSIVDGAVTGAAAGLAFLGSHAVVTEQASFDCPETGIGFFPDAAATYLLAGLHNSFGMLLGLTGVRLAWGDALWCGLATHAVASADLLPLLNQLCRETSPDGALRHFRQEPPRETNDATVHAIATHFSRDSLSGVLASLQSTVGPRDPFARSMLRLLEAKSPTSLAVAFSQIQSGRMMTVDECLKLEFRIVNRMVDGHDFPEGVRAMRRKIQPLWLPERLKEIDAGTVNGFFAPLRGGDLEL